MNRKSRKTPQTAVYLDHWIKRCIAEKARKEGYSLSSYIKKLVTEDLELTLDDEKSNVVTFVDPDDEVFKPLEGVTWIIDVKGNGNE